MWSKAGEVQTRPLPGDARGAAQKLPEFMVEAAGALLRSSQASADAINAQTFREGGATELLRI